MLNRSLLHSALTIPFPNGQQMFSTPYLTSLQYLTDKDGKQVGNVGQQMMPAVPEDISDEVLTVLQSQLALIGLSVSRA